MGDQQLHHLCCIGVTQNDRCLGPIVRNGENISCASCGKVYPICNGIPLLHAEMPQTSPDKWFENMYAGRSRTKELESDYLRKERQLVSDFVAGNSVTGPCLEVGCGVGLFAECVPQFIGLEYSLQALCVPGFDFFHKVCGDAARLPFLTGSMQLVFSFNTLEHVPQVRLAFSEIDRVCAPGGFIILKPAWHCTRYVTELIPMRPYSALSFRQKLVKALLPVIKSKPYKLLGKLPWRVWRRLRSKGPSVLNYRKLVPYQGADWIPDADAEVSLDSHEGILYFVSRGYQCLSHKGVLRQLLAGHDIVVLKKSKACKR
jgi:SAM-dependent methyltransferase